MVISALIPVSMFVVAVLFVRRICQENKALKEMEESRKTWTWD